MTRITHRTYPSVGGLFSGSLSEPKMEGLFGNRVSMIIYELI